MNKFNKFIENKHNKSKLHFSPFQNYSNHFLCECGGFESNYVEDLKIFSYLVVLYYIVVSFLADFKLSVVIG